MGSTAWFLAKSTRFCLAKNGISSRHRQAFTRRGVSVKQRFDTFAGECCIDDGGDIARVDLGIEGCPRLCHDEGAHFAEPMTPCDAQGNPINEIVLDEVSFDDALNVVRTARLARCSRADSDARPKPLLTVSDGLPQFLQFVDRAESGH